MNNDVFTLDENNNAAIRTVGVNGVAESNSPSVFTQDENGNACIRVTGSGGGDQHNLGYFATQAALEEAYPTATAGDWAIVGATDTVWIWDEDTSAWVDSDQKGQVTSVNGQTGAVTLGINDVAPTQTGKSGYVLETDGFVAGWVKPEIVQRSTMPQASEDELGNVYQFVGTTDANYTNGYFYKCASDGQNPATYSWSQVDVQPAADPLPSQTGQSGKFLTTDGTDASWSDKPLVNTNSSNTPTTLIVGNNGGTLSSIGDYAVCLTHMGDYGGWIALGEGAIAIGMSKNSSGYKSINIGGSSCSGNYAIQLGGSGANSDANTFKVANANGNYEIMSADGTIPEARLADTTNATAGQALVLDSQGNAVWSDVSSSPAIAPALIAANWSNNQQTVNVTGVTATNTVIVAPFPTDAQDYASAGILCIGQGAGTLTFSCTSVPASDLQVNVVII